MHTFRPHPYVRAFRYPLPVILVCLHLKVLTDSWERGLYRQIQQSWWRRLCMGASHDETIALTGMRIVVISLVFWFILCDALLL